MKSVIKGLVGKTAGSGAFKPVYNLAGSVGQVLADVSDYAQRQRAMGLSDDVKQHLIATRFGDLRVKHGLFKGLAYPRPIATGSAFMAKVLGSYEMELAGAFEDMLKRGHTAFVDIGCAEGYYAVGCAMLMPGAKVYAFDTEEPAQALCRDMAAANNVSDRVEVSGFCDSDTLKTLDLGARSLILSDCEGYESELFTPALIKSLAQHDFIIECHDFMDPSISAMMKEAFAETHDVEMVQSVDDFWKARTLDYPELDGLDPLIRRFVVAENRPCTMEWLVAKSRQPLA